MRERKQTRRSIKVDFYDCLVLEGVLKKFWFLPGVRWVSEVTVRGGDLVLRLLEIELLDCEREGGEEGESARGRRWVLDEGEEAKRTDDSGSEVEVLVDNLNEVLVRVPRGSVGVDEDGERLSDTDGVGELDEDSSSESGGDEGLG